MLNVIFAVLTLSALATSHNRLHIAVYLWLISASGPERSSAFAKNSSQSNLLTNASAAPPGKLEAGEVASLPQLRYAAALFFCCAALKISWTSPAGGSTQLTPSTQGVHQSQHSYHCQGTHTATQARLPNPLTAKHLQVQADTSLPDLCIRYQAAPRRQGIAQVHRQCSW